MSKSKKNTIDPEQMIELYGADAVRLFILSDSPPEKDIQWSDNGMSSSYKFIQKFWTMNQEIHELVKKKQVPPSDELEIFTNQTIEKINNCLEKFRYNVIIALFYEIYSFYKRKLEQKLNYKNLKINFKKILIVMMPVLPHLTNESLEILGENTDTEWPSPKQELLEKSEKQIVIQINGKKRNVISIRKGTEEKDILKDIKDLKLVDKYIKDKKVFKVIFVKDKIINLLVK